MEKKALQISIGHKAREALEVAIVASIGIVGMCAAYYCGHKIAVHRLGCGFRALERVEPGFINHTNELVEKYKQLYCK